MSKFQITLTVENEFNNTAEALDWVQKKFQGDVLAATISVEVEELAYNDTEED